MFNKLEQYLKLQTHKSNEVSHNFLDELWASDG